MSSSQIRPAASGGTLATQFLVDQLNLYQTGGEGAQYAHHITMHRSQRGPFNKFSKKKIMKGF